MTKQRLILPADSSLLRAKGSTILHTYPDGKLLVEVPKEIIDTGENETSEAISTGLKIPSPHTFENKARFNWKHLDAKKELLAFVELIGPVDADWLAELGANNIRVLRYQPAHCYLCQGRIEDFRIVERQAFVQGITPLDKTMKPQAEIGESGTSPVVIIYVNSLDDTDTPISRLRNLQGVEIDPTAAIETIDFYLRIPAQVSGTGHDLLLQHPAVLAVESLEVPKPEGEVANLILAGSYDQKGVPGGDYLEWLQERNIGGHGVAIGIVDSGVDHTHPAFEGRITDLATGRKDWHGTFVASCAAGDYRTETDQDGNRGGLGVAPKADIIAIDKSGVTANPGRTCRQTVNQSGPSGASGYIQNNSWGAGTRDPMNYTSLEAAYDRLVRNADPDNAIPKPIVICFSAGNRGRNGLTRPKAAKNVIVTGNSESYQDIGGVFGNNIDDVYFDESWQPSSLGNCGDGRVRPHLVAPGEWSMAANYGMEPGHIEYISPGLTWCGGSSAASPKTAGACAILVDWWRQHFNGQTPSPAMLRALLVNGAAPMPHSSVNLPDGRLTETIPNALQGWGRLNLANILDKKAKRIYLDQSVILKNRGDSWSQPLQVVDPSQAVRITLTWTDPPGNIYTGDSIDNPAIVNRLNLRLATGDKQYHGNHFEHGWSVPGEIADSRMRGIDNTQNIFLPPGSIKDNFQINVEALDITTNCFDFQSIQPQQDFALVIHNARRDPTVVPAEVFVLTDQSGPAPTTNSNGQDKTVEVEDDDQWAEPAEEPTDLNNWWFSEDQFDWYAESNYRKIESESMQRTQSIEQPSVLARQLTSLGNSKNKVQVISKPSDESAARHFTSGDLLSFLKELSTSWEALGPDQSKVGVLVLHQHSNLNQAAIKLLRMLCFTGDLYIVAAEAEVLRKLAQYLPDAQGLHLRSAASPAKLETIFQETLAEAGGALQAKVHKGKVTDKQGALFHAYGADVIDNDRNITFFLTWEKEAPRALQLMVPGGKHFPIDLSDQNEGVINDHLRYRIGEKSISLEVDTALSPTPGRYVLVSPESHPLEVKAWTTVSSLFSVVIEAEKNKEANDQGWLKQMLLAIRGKSAISLKNAEVFSHNILTAQQVDTDQETKVRSLLQVPLRTASGASSESTRKLTSPVLSQWINYRTINETLLLLELRVEVEGIDARGYPFQRMVKLNKIEPLPHYQAPRFPKRHFKAKIVKKYYSGGVLRALRLKSAVGERDFRISDPDFGAWIDELNLERYPLEFTTLKSTILTISQILEASIQ